MMTTTIDRQKSHEIFVQAQQLMPGGVNSPARAFGAVGGEPIVVERGAGAYLYDVDGNQYVDYIGSWGPMILGHQHPAVVTALEAAIAKGTSFGAPTQAENTLAGLIIESIPSVERVRLVNSGTEATMSAIRLARGFTGREIIIKFAGNYHGHADSLLVAAGSSAATLSVPNSPGVTEGTTKDTMVLHYNDVDGLGDAFREHGNRIAGAIIEPVVGNMGCVKPTEEFLYTLRNLTADFNALLIFDEVMTGFRVALGGAQERFGVTPDLTTLGKILGGGLPIGAYGGRADIMDHVLPTGKVFQAGTLSGNPVATASGIATLNTLRKQPPYEQLEVKSACLETGLTEAANVADVTAHVARVGSMLTLFFHKGPVDDWNAAAECNTQKFAEFFWGMMNFGIYLPCSQFEAMFVSAAHSDDDIQRTVEAAEQVLRKLR